MVPRIDTVFLSVDMDHDELLEKIAESGHSRFPVYKDTIDNVIGILYVKDLLRTLVKHETINIPTIVRKPFFVPGSMANRRLFLFIIRIYSRYSSYTSYHQRVYLQNEPAKYY